jgi:hypothetical protein
LGSLARGSVPSRRVTCGEIIERSSAAQLLDNLGPRLEHHLRTASALARLAAKATLTNAADISATGNQVLSDLNVRCTLILLASWICERESSRSTLTSFPRGHHVAADTELFRFILTVFFDVDLREVRVFGGVYRTTNCLMHTRAGLTHDYFRVHA